VKQIAERSEGVPLFVEEVTKAVLESGAVRLDADRYELAPSFDGQSVPATVQASLVARFDRLGDSRGVAQLGATIGRDFSYRLIRAVTGLADSELREHLDRLCRSELAFVEGEPPQAVYTFKHALIQDAIYGMLLKKDRAPLHERVFTKLRDEFPEVVQARPEMAAYHAEHAGLRGVAVPLLQQAGVRAFGRVNMAEAARHLGHAIELVDSLAEPERTTVEMELQAIVGPTYMATLGWAVPEVERSCARLRDLASGRGDGVKLYQAMWGLWTVHFLRGQYEPALEVAKQVLGMATYTGDPMLLVTGHHAVGYTHLRRGEYAEAIRHADEALALFDLEREKKIVGLFVFSSTCAILWFKGQAQLALGELQAGEESLRRARALVDELGHAPSRAFMLSQQCLSLAVESVGDIVAMSRTMRTLAVQEGFALWVPYSDIYLAWASANQGGDAAAAAERIKAAMALVHKGLSHIQDIEFSRMLAEAWLLAGRPAEVFPVAEAAMEAARVGKQGHLESELYRLQGEAARAQGDVAKAAAFHRQAIESARAVGGRLLELRATLGLARVGGSEERALLTAALAGIGDGAEHPDVKAAQAFLAVDGQGQSREALSWVRP
jgi:tetratricopeptide (TPR) repeat protein